MANASTVKGLLEEIIDDGIPITSTGSDIVSVEQSDKTKLKGTMELSAGNTIIGEVGIDQTTDGTTNKVNAQNATHDNLNCNANMQINNADASTSNPLTVDTKNVNDAMMGNLGGVYSAAATITPAATFIFNAIQIITDAVLTCTGSPTGITTIAFTAGTIIYGRFSQIVIASGTIIAYQGK